jgi:hypothetical protein
MNLAAEIEHELEMGLTARKAGNEGRARVCARRAAGLAAGDFLSRHGLRAQDGAYQALQRLALFPGLSPELTQAAQYLTMRVSGEFQLPAGVDLIAEANKLIGGLK